MRIFGLIFILILLLTTWFNISCGTGDSAVTGKTDEKKVTLKKVEGRWMLYRNGAPFFVKGAAGYTYLEELSRIGGNTIRTWDTTNLKAILDKADSLGLAVVAGFDLPGSHQATSFYKDTALVNELLRSLEGCVKKYRNHPALLAWCLGNELRFPFHVRHIPFYDAYNKMLRLIKKEDPDHPVTTPLANFEKREIINIQARINGLDFISINTFGRMKNLKEDLQSFSWFWEGPFLLTEWGIPGGWESETTAWQSSIENTSSKKAEQYRELYKEELPHDDPRFLGSLVFYWGNKQEYTHTWFSFFTENGRPTELVEALNDCWNDTVSARLSPRIKYMLVDKLGARDQLLCSPGTTHAAEVFMEHSEENISYDWEIVRDDWWGQYKGKWIKPLPENKLWIDSTGNTVMFKTPDAEGPYRIFVTVTNSKGYAATANTPFYVVGE
ncbi:MAG: glycoside hydrolase family 2 TIM barrel-domain containing protein [Chitinophagaceae bacterium]